ncbi:uroporphyrinogen-III synthase [Shewanella algae]|uniref:uroporphyrinogen-III synthase n=1 Tax=Shewanella algae TaxID=38313 RepID=UPI001187601E|nr:uroporphyrinogen-III synthase [Shewanella algae]TVO97746.1 uroporphyrinogen III synthase [Shewanella algae]
MRVLLTRPEGRNHAMEQALTERGIPFMVTPLLAVEAMEDKGISPAEVLDADIIVFVSTNAVHFGTQALNAPWPSHIQYFAVGEATFEAFAQYGIRGHKAPDDNQQTEGLLTLPGLQPEAVKHKKVVIIRGNGGREVLGQTLQQYGASVQFWEVYRRTCPAYDAVQLVKEWQGFGIDTIVLSSAESLMNLIRLLPKEYFAWLQACHIIVPSIRVVDKAVVAGLAQVTDATAANSKAVLKALRL